MYCQLCIYTYTHYMYTLHETNIALRKLMLGRRSFPFKGYFQVLSLLVLGSVYVWENLPCRISLESWGWWIMLVVVPCIHILLPRNFNIDPWKRDQFKRKLHSYQPFQPSIFRGYVSFGGSIWTLSTPENWLVVTHPSQLSFCLIDLFKFNLTACRWLGEL